MKLLKGLAVIVTIAAMGGLVYSVYDSIQGNSEERQQSIDELNKSMEELAQGIIFDEALKSSYGAAVLTQTAKTVEDWTQVQQGWKSAIDQLASIPESNEKYEQAQQKIGEYQANLTYAEQKLASTISQAPAPTSPSFIGRSSTGEWFVGGNLHNKTIMEWNRGSADNKLATAGDMAEFLLPHLATPALVKPYAEDLVKCMDETGKKNPNADEKEKQVEEVLESTHVSEVAALCATFMGWPI